MKWRDDPEWVERVKVARAWQYTDPEHIQQRRAAKKQNWADSEWAEQTIAAQNKGKRTPKARQRNAETTKALWDDPNYRAKMEAHLGSPKQRQRFSEQRLVAWKRGCYDGVFRNPSSLEAELAQALDERGIQYIQQHRLEGDSRPFDFFLPPRLLIEVDGEYWHQKSGAAERDRLKTKLAEQRGFILKRISGRAFREIGPKGIVRRKILPLLNEINSLLETSSRLEQ